MRKIPVALAVTMFVLSLTTAPGAQYEGTTTGLTTSDPSPTVGGVFTVSGSGCAANSTVNLSISGKSAGTTTASGSGAFSGSLTAPSTAGTYTVNAQCGSTVLGVRITVDPATQTTTTTTGTSPLAFSGSDTIRLLPWALALIAVGGIAVMVSRRQTKPPATPVEDREPVSVDA